MIYYYYLNNTILNCFPNFIIVREIYEIDEHNINFISSRLN